ncbi:hypothetical protein [Xanthomonas arboricola]|uniref:hypothetical protein n=1 Tax=Xanthomonas arboricola TaxID=56448 RepID=UPI0014318F01|nr:hypothetical protein [Xanthomonas arboricola]NJB93179.1 hypothetical protein [Xanthomonas arboricola]
MKLDHLQRELEWRFERLSEGSSEGRRVFALEHGLSIDLVELAAELSQQLRYGNPRQAHWLVWVVFATEIGYSFAGAEYWQTFGDRLPAWRLSAVGNRNRSQIRVWFRKFANKYNGVRPSGTWAKQFSIIAWPITHAILPRDLQFQFAKSLHHNRFRLATENDPIGVGYLIHTQTPPTSSRFREFSEQEELVGRIALALLRVGTEELPLSPEATKRIIGDLEVTQAAKDWLQAAREVRCVRGARKAEQTGREPAEHQEETQARLNLRPTLLLSRTDAAWKVGVMIPSFAPFASLEASVKQFLISTKIQLQGGTGSWQPGQMLTGRSRLHMLQRWPDDGAVIRFKDPNPILEHLLREDATLGNGPIWVCKVGADGLARQVRCGQVRPGHAYILLARASHSFPRNEALEPIALQCDGILGVRLELPKQLPKDIRQLLQSLELKLTSTVRIWPAGIPAFSWDGEGFSEWLTTDSPSFGIDVDYEANSFDVVLNGSNRLSISRHGVTGPSWVQLSPLPPGQHSLTIEVKGSDGGNQAQAITTGEVVLDVRDPMGLEDSVNQRGGLMAIAAPVDAALEDLEQGSLSIEFFGPKGRKLELCLEIAGSDSTRFSLGIIELPAVVSDLLKRLPNDAQELLGVSVSCRLVANADEIGAFVLPLERTSRPARWLLERSKQAIALRLVDEAGLGAGADCQMSPLDRPSAAQLLEYEDCVDGIYVTPPGALYVVTGKGRMDAVVVSLPNQQRGGDIASQIGFSPALDKYAASVDSVKEDIQLLTLWSKARVTGLLGAARHGKIVRTMRDALTRLVCGEVWVQAEAVFESSDKGTEAVADLGESVSAGQEQRNFAAKLRLSHQEAAEKTPEEVVSWLLPITVAFGICENKDAVKNALRYFTDPAGFVVSSTNPVKDVRDLALQGDLLRGIRYLQILLKDRSWDWT